MGASGIGRAATIRFASIFSRIHGRYLLSYMYSGKLINAKRQIMQPSHYSSKPVQEVKQLFDNGVYPKYADNMDNIQKLWNLAVKLTNLNESF